MYLIPKYIVWAKSKKTKQPINKYVPNHKDKKDTPTMGGAIFLFSTIVASLLTVKLTNIFVVGAFIVLIGFGAIGFKDDLGKVLSGDNLKGLTPRGKMGLLLALSSTVALMLYLYDGFPTTFYLPFVKYPIFDMGVFAVPFWILVLIASSNSVNLTDGLDGLATVPTIFALSTLGVIVYIIGHALLAKYLLLPNIKGVGEVVIVAAALAGGLLSFLWYNSYPAELFMGDTGSLSIGAFLGYLAILAKSEVLLIIIGVVFVIETLSVLIQVFVYKSTNKRFFLMAPLHHHFEMKGWPENKIIVRFWIIAFLANLLALITLKIR
jgi:phospho-N-acetylmuramoyl-pentapeptide-transferase